MKKTVGFIGCGNMGGALALACAKRIDAELLLLSDLYLPKLNEICEKTGGRAVDAAEIAKNADLIVLAIKPQVYPSVIAQIAPLLAERETKPLIISIAAGITVDQVRKMGVGKACPVIRIMPNTPASVGEGVILYVCSSCSEEDKDAFLTAFDGAGGLYPIAEDKIDAASALSGCGPAFVCLFAEALADGAVACGLPRSDANIYAAQTLLGTARLMLESHTHPGVLKDAVCSPGGTTIQGVRALEEGGLRAAAMNAVIAAYEKTLELKAGSSK